MSRKPTLQAAVSWGDLLTFQALPGAGPQAAEAAALLGLPPVVLPERAPGGTGKGAKQKDKPKSKGPSTTSPFRLPLRMPLGLVVEQSDARPQAARPLDLPLWGPQEAAEVEAMLAPSGLPPAEPKTLLDLPKSIALCRRALLQTHAKGLDIDETVSALAQGRWPEPLPQHQQRSRLKQAHIGVDVHAAHQFLVDDYQALLHGLSAHFPGLQQQLCELDDPASWSQWAASIEGADPSIPVFIVCEPSLLLKPERLHLQRIARHLQRLGRRVVWPMAWQGSGREPVLETFDFRADPRVNTLLACLSPAVTVEPGLVRAMVAEMGWQAASLALEDALWTHPALDGAWPFRQWHPAAQRQALSTLQGLSDGVQSRCWPVIAQHHVHRHQVQRDQELLNWVSAVAPAVQSRAVPEPQRQAAQTRYARVAQHLLNLGGQHVSEAGGHQSRSGLVVAAAHERLQTLPECLNAYKEVEDMLAKAALQGAIKAGQDTSASSQTEPRSRDMRLRLQGQSLCLVSDGSPARPGLDLKELEVSGDWVRVEAADGRRGVLSLSAPHLEHVPLVLQEWREAPPREIKVSGATGQVEIKTSERPSWAASFRQSSEGLQALIYWPDGVGQWVPGPFVEGLIVVRPGALLAIDPHGPRLKLAHVVSAGLPQLIGEFSFRYLPPATFLMGSPDGVGEDREHPQHPVTLTQSLWLAEAPCTQALWKAVMGRNPSHFNKGPEAPQRPVEKVSWDDVQQFLAKLNALLPEGCEAVLPTEAHWEYACRAGTATAYWWGDEPDDSKANFDSRGDKDWDDKEGTTPVDRYPPNPWGLRDMHGNVWEWCADGELRTYEPATARDPMGDTGGDARVVRGGAWFDRPVNASSAFRSWGHQGYRSPLLGFRLALRSSSLGAEPQPGGLKTDQAAKKGGAAPGRTAGTGASGKATRAQAKKKGPA
ncbi:MAG: SUMF1/EgtB/PvdO family nonheme iron enzyme [Ideonella sp.]|nr:SUMF1/EgtB/PvdO family nonheme iron enzyme [Ideonella sp.]